MSSKSIKAVAVRWPTVASRTADRALPANAARRASSLLVGPLSSKVQPAAFATRHVFDGPFNGNFGCGPGCAGLCRQHGRRHASRSFSGSDKPVPDADSAAAAEAAATPSQGAAPGLPGSQTGGKKLAIVFTCTVCDTRSAKQFTEHAYRHGVVIVQCPGCKSRHLIADNLSMFTGDDTAADPAKNEGWNIEKAMSRLGQPVTSVNNDNVFELTLDQVVGAEALRKAMGGVSDETTKQSNTADDGNDKNRR